MVRAQTCCLAVRTADRAAACAGRVIHEFDPWFNYRATEYMAANGWEKFQVGSRRCPCFPSRPGQVTKTLSLVRRSSHQQH